MDNYTNKLKQRKMLVLSQFLFDSARLSGKTRIKDIEGVVLSLRAGGVPDTPDFEGITWTITDAKKIAEMSMVRYSDQEQLTKTIYRALTARIPLPDNIEVRKCSSCREEKVVGEAITACDWLCRECRRAANKARNIGQSISGSIRCYQRRKAG